MINRRLSKTTPNTSNASEMKYKRTTPTLVGIGGLPAGTVPDGTVQELLDLMLYPYQSPAFTSLTFNLLPSILELGQAINASYTVAWAVSNAANILPSSYSLKNLNTNSFLFQNFNGLSRSTAIAILNSQTNVPGNIAFQIGGTNTLNQAFTRNTNIACNSRRFAGVLDSDGLENILYQLEFYSNFGLGINVSTIVSFFRNISYNDLTYSKNGTTLFNCSGIVGGGYVLYAYDAALGSSSFTSGAFPAAFRPLLTAPVVNAFGVIRTYNFYISSNAFNAPALSISVA
jgi:hypothetical protein